MLGWGLDTETQDVEVCPGRGLGLAVWRQSEGLGSGVPQAGEWNTTAKGSREEVWAAGEARCHCWGG